MTRSMEFLWRGGRSGVLLIHGLTGTPAEMRFVAKGLHDAGFTVCAVQLAGHCGDAADLLATRWRDWYESVDAAATKLRADVDHLFVAGLSMGALLALELAIERPDEVDGVGLYGTTFRYDGWAIPPIARLSFMLPLVCALGLGRERTFMETFPYGIKNDRIRNWIVGSMLAGDSGAGGLPGNPWPSLAEFVRLSGHVRRRLDRVRAPCLIVHATDDDIASLDNVAIVEQHVSAPVEKMLLSDSYHMITVDQQRDLVIERSAGFFKRIAGVAVPEPQAVAIR
ncbi:MAG TPA: alpha/beta fold hydrolase [Caldimonas sp.]|nr:alpha/beta fold hydrolase [Caldimonas sp.]